MTIVDQLSERDRHFVDVAWTTCEMTLKEKGEIRMMAVLINRDNGRLTIVPGIGGSKAIIATMIEYAVIASNADMIVMMSEAWTIDPPMTMEEIEAWYGSGKGAADHPNRLEIVQVSFKTKDGYEGVKARRIARDSKGKPSLGADFPIPSKNGGWNRYFDNLWKTVQ